MPNINLDVDYFDHVKTVRLIGLLGKGSAELPIRLWCYCGKHRAKDGNLTGLSAQEIEAFVGWWGKPGAMVRAMVQVGFLDDTPDGYQLHDWGEREGHLRVFHERAKAAAAARWGTPVDASSNAPSNASSMPQAMPQPYRTSRTKKEPLTPAELGQRRLSPRDARQNPRALGENPRALAAQSLEEQRRYVTPPVPDEDQVMTGEDIAKMRVAIKEQAAKLKRILP
jgi:hypothetical protein